jgi:hypothetical protein
MMSDCILGLNGGVEFELELDSPAEFDDFARLLQLFLPDLVFISNLNILLDSSIELF